MVNVNYLYQHLSADINLSAFTLNVHESNALLKKKSLDVFLKIYVHLKEASKT